MQPYAGKSFKINYLVIFMRIVCNYGLVLFHVMVLFSFPAQAFQSWVVPVQHENLAPFKYRLNDRPVGIEVDLLTAVATEIGTTVRFEDHSIKEGRLAFERGDVSVDCCLNSVWFPRKESKDVQLFSEPLFRIMEVWVFPKGKDFHVSGPQDLKDKTVIGIKGFNYPGENQFGTRIDGGSPREVLDMLLAGKGDVAILERHVASYMINREKRDAVFGNLYYAVDVAIRLHKSLAGQLPAINKAIEKLKSEGRIEEIIRTNLR